MDPPHYYFFQMSPTHAMIYFLSSLEFKELYKCVCMLPPLEFEGDAKCMLLQYDTINRNIDFNQQSYKSFNNMSVSSSIKHARSNLSRPIQNV